MFKKIITIVLPVLAITAAIFIFGLKVYQDSFDKFQYDGYVLGVSGKESSKYYFTKDEKYKVNETKNEVAFVDKDEKDVVVPEASFVHYADGSISTFKKAVVLNLNNVKTDSLQYYNIYNGSVFTKTNKGYQIQHLEQKLVFDNFIVKISDSKYMMAGKGLKIKYGDKEENISDGFLEINYLDGNIIKIENQDLYLQNISSDFAIEVDGVKLDLINKKIVYDGQTKVNLGEITIDSDDNIEIIPDKENTVIDQEAIDKIEDLENSPIVTPGSNVDGMESGVVDTTIEEADKIIQDNEKIPDPIFTVSSMTLTPTLVNMKVNVEDPGGTLVTDGKDKFISWKIINTATNEIPDGCKMDNATMNNVEPQCTILEPNTNYLVVVSSEYIKNGYTYKKDFIQRTFVTPSVGVSIDKDYSSSTAMSFRVKVNETSTLTEFKYKVIDSESGKNASPIVEGSFLRKGTNIKGCDNYTDNEADKSISNINECYVEVSGLEPNRKYSLIVYDFTHSDNLTMPEKYEVYKTLKTLKQSPTFGTTSVVVNKLSSKFSIYLNSIKDPYNSVTSYRADIYPASQINNPEAMVAQREAPASGQIEIGVDDNIIKRNIAYQAKIYLVYNDNEKEYEKYIGTTSTMTMGSTIAPTVAFTPSVINHDMISGFLTITDAESIISANSELTILMTDLSDGRITTPFKISANENNLATGGAINFAVRNLRANTSYLFSVQGYLDLDDGNDEYVYTTIGTFIVQTTEATAQNAVLTQMHGFDTDYKDAVFAIGFTLTDGDQKASSNQNDEVSDGDNSVFVEIPKDGTHELYTMKEFYIRFRKSSSVINSMAECTVENECWYKKYTDGTPQNDRVNELYVSTLKDQFYQKNYDVNDPSVVFCVGDNSNCGDNQNAIVFSEIDTTLLKKTQYIFEIVDAVDYTSYPNKLLIKNHDKTELVDAQIMVDLNEMPEPEQKPEFTEEFVYTTGATSTSSSSNPRDEIYGANTKEKADHNDIFKIVSGYSITVNYNKTEIAESDVVETKYYLVDLTPGLNVDGTQKPIKSYELVHGAEANAFVYVNDNNIEFTFADFKTYYANVNDTEYKGAEIQRGHIYGFYYTVYNQTKGKSIVTASQSFRIFKEDRQPQKPIPYVIAYLSETIKKGEDSFFVYKYKKDDGYSAILQDETYGKSVVWTDSYSTSGEQIAKCKDSETEEYTKTKDCLKDKTGKVAIVTKATSVTANVYYKYRVLEGCQNENIQFITPKGETIGGKCKISAKEGIDYIVKEQNLNRMYVYAQSGNEDELDYTRSFGQNTVIYTFDKTYQKSFLTNRVVGAQLTFEAESQKVTIYKTFDNNGWNSDSIYTDNTIQPTITVDFGEIADLMGKGTVSVDIVLLYDKDVYGNENDDGEDYGYLLEVTRAGIPDYTSLTYKNLIFKKLDYKFNSQNYIDVYLYYDHEEEKEAEEGTLTKKLTHGILGLNYTDSGGVKNYVQIKKVYGMPTSCYDGTCDFDFDSITPTLILEEEHIKAGMGSATYEIKVDINPKLTGFNLIKRYYQADSNGRCLVDASGQMIPEEPVGTYFEYEKRYTKEDLEALKDGTGRYVIVDDNLDFGKKYCVTFSYSAQPEGGEEVIDADFYYSDGVISTPEDRRTYVIGTRSRPYYYKNNYLTNGINVEYATGQIQKYDSKGNVVGSYNENDYRNIQSADYGKSVTIDTVLEFKEGIDGFDFVLQKKDSEGIYQDINEVKIDPVYTSEISSGLVMTFTVPLDPVKSAEDPNTMIYFPTTDIYGIKIIPFKYCNTEQEQTTREEFKCKALLPQEEVPSEVYGGEDPETAPSYNGKRNLSVKNFSFTYSIIKPSVSIARTRSVTETGEDGLEAPNGFALRISVDDRYRTAGNYSSNIKFDASGNILPESLDAEGNVINPVKKAANYKVEITTDAGTEILGEYEITKAIDTFVINEIDKCAGSSICEIKVSYQVNMYNNNESYVETQSVTKTIDYTLEVDLGNISPTSVTTKQIGLTFTDSYNIAGNVTKANYILRPSSGTEIYENNKAITFSTIESENGVYVLYLKPKSTMTKNRKYSLQITFLTTDDIIVGVYNATIVPTTA